MASDDEDRTVFGQKLPPQPAKPAAQPALPPPAQGQQPPPTPQAAPPAQGENTVFGQRLPPQQPAAPYPPQQPAPQQPPQYGQPPAHPPAAPPRGGEDTWLGGALTPTPGAPLPPPQAAPPQQPYYPPPPPAAPQQPYPPAQQPYPAQQPAGQYPPHYPDPYAGQPHPGWTPASPPADGQFPVAGAQPQPQPQRTGPKIAFTDALRGSGLDVGSSSNPIIAAASDLLVLLGRLRTGMVEMQAIPLRDHVMREIASFVQKCQEAGVPPEDIDVARYALAATSDDIVQTIPGNDPQYWQQFSMAAELLADRSAGIGFFARLEQVIGLPGQRAHVLELMLTCLALGFEGKYRTEPNGQVMLSRLRTEVYQRFRSANARPPEELSHKWIPVLLGGRRQSGGMPLWVVGGVASAMVVALFITLSWLLSGDAQAAQDDIIGLHTNLGEVVIERSENVIEYEAPPTGQLERIQGRLAAEIEAGDVEVEEAGDYISVRLRDALRFGSGSAELTTDVSGLGKRIAEVLEGEPGDIIVEGHSDNIPPSGRGRYKTNEALSEARAETVRALLEPHLSNPGRMTVEGVGPAKPLDTANTREARAKNRRVEILLQKEQRL
ncbi:type IVB secretion system protein IcmH/DotU [uncultured Tateyamaria sp.]|uniref:type IVB secretion system protein IcmH/DotU n=1 Tax=Tateyamaria sp. 1078 TaxID=3417464 RepID=UPI0026137277|nr:type IVB secretion system protein IcmH/DotU [uncultured Tateyamaria sp.]